MRYLITACVLLSACSLPSSPRLTTTELIKCHVNEGPKAIVRCVDQAGAVCYTPAYGDAIQCFPAQTAPRQAQAPRPTPAPQPEGK